MTQSRLPSKEQPAPASRRPAYFTVDVTARYFREEGLPSNHITALYFTGRDAWVGTADAGVARLNFNEGNWIVTKKEDGLASEIQFQLRLFRRQRVPFGFLGDRLVAELRLVRTAR